MTKALEYAEILRECLETEFALLDPDLRPARVEHRHGVEFIPLLGTGTDECCSGIAWVRIVSVEPRYERNEPVAACFPSSELITLELGSVFCMPWGTVQAPPTGDQWLQVVFRADSDRGVMKRALCCARGQVDASYRMLGLNYLPYGPDGNCTGGTMTVQVEADCGCA